MRSYDSAPRLASTAHLQLYLVFFFWTTPLREASSCFVSRACTLCTFYQEFRPMRMKNCAPLLPKCISRIPFLFSRHGDFPLLNRVYVIFPSCCVQIIWMISFRAVGLATNEAKCWTLYHIYKNHKNQITYKQISVQVQLPNLPMI